MPERTGPNRRERCCLADWARSWRHPLERSAGTSLAASCVTRFYGPPFAQLGGAHVDIGNAYLQPPHVDVAPEPGQLILFPSWLAHQALPYDGERDRLIVSFNASVHAAQGGNRLHGYSAA